MATKFALAEPARTRIIRMTNVDFDATEEDIQDFFAGFNIEDQFRTKNTKTKNNSIVYVLFATVADRIRAGKINGAFVLGRAIKVQPAPNGNYDLNHEETAFVKTGKATAAPEEAANQAPPHFTDYEFPSLGMKVDTEARNDALNAPPVTGDTTTVTEKAIGSNYQAFMKDLGKMSLADQPSTGAARRVEDQMPEVPFGTTAKEATSSGVPVPGRWNLAGNDPTDRSKNVITEDDWYNFQPQEFAKLARQVRMSSSLRRILEDAGHEEDMEGRWVD